MTGPDIIARRRARIEASVERDAAGCWLWQKTCHKNGYGSFALGAGHNVLAHRGAYEAFVGPIPVGMRVCHRCDVRRCVNPDHLFLGTQSENIRDAVAKGRIDRTTRVRGSAHPSSKLSEEDVPAILRRLRAGETKASLARAFGVSDTIIRLIERGQLWKHARAT